MCCHVWNGLNATPVDPGLNSMFTTGMIPTRLPECLSDDCGSSDFWGWEGGMKRRAGIMNVMPAYKHGCYDHDHHHNHHFMIMGSWWWWGSKRRSRRCEEQITEASYPLFLSWMIRCFVHLLWTECYFMRETADGSLLPGPVNHNSSSRVWNIVHNISHPAACKWISKPSTSRKNNRDAYNSITGTGGIRKSCILAFN